MSEQKIKDALEIAVRSGQCNGAHHKAWAIDQMVRVLTGCQTARDRDDRLIVVEESEEYEALVRDAKACDGDPDAYDWDTGIAP